MSAPTGRTQTTSDGQMAAAEQIAEARPALRVPPVVGGAATLPMLKGYFLCFPKLF